MLFDLLRSLSSFPQFHLHIKKDFMTNDLMLYTDSLHSALQDAIKNASIPSLDTRLDRSSLCCGNIRLALMILLVVLSIVGLKVA